MRMSPSPCQVSISLALAASLTALLVPPMPTFAQSEVESVSTPDISKAVVTLEGVGGKGTGTIIEAEGLVLTSEHIIRDFRGGQVSVLTEEGVRYPGKVIVVDRAHDLALIQILSNQTFSPLPLAEEGSLEAGEAVYALENPFASFETLIVGELQKIKPTLGYLSTNLALTPGDSGGPLVNAQGELIGVNRAMIEVQGENQKKSWGLATPVHLVREFLERARSDDFSSQFAQERPRAVNLGITLVPGTLEIMKVEPNSLADEWGLRTGDELVGYNHRRLDSLEDLQDFLATEPSEVLLFLRRNSHLVRWRVRL
ncbi:MAG: S1C family serine protease [Halothece sp.]